MNNKSAITTLLAILLLAGVLQGCKKEGDASTNLQEAVAQAKEGGIPFLNDLGIDVKNVIADSVIDLSGDWDSIPRIELNDTLAATLLKDVRVAEMKADLFEASIVAVRPLAEDKTLIAFELFVGDIDGVLMAIYDRQGKMLDAINAGTWNKTLPYSMVEDGTEEDVLKDSAICRFTSDREFVLNRSVCRVSSKNGVKWRMTRDYNYTVTDNGMLSLEVKHKKMNGKFDEDDPQKGIFDITDLQRYPQSCNGLMERLDTMASQIGPTNEVYMDFIDQLTRIFQTNGQELFAYMSGKEQNHLRATFKAVLAEGFLLREDLDATIGAIKDPAIKKYAESEVKKWGKVPHAPIMPVGKKQKD